MATVMRQTTWLTTGDLENGGRMVPTNVDDVGALLDAAKALFDSTTTCTRGSWLVPNAALRALVRAIETVDPKWREEEGADAPSKD